MNEIETYVVLWAEMLSISTSAVTPKAYGSADGYPEGASAIVEPWLGVSDTQLFPECNAYYEWSENNPKAWASWIRSTFGKDWGDVADRINVEGY